MGREEQSEPGETSAEPGFWQDPLWRTWRPPVAAGVAVGISVALAEWFGWGRPLTYGLIALGVILGYIVFGLWLYAKRR